MGRISLGKEITSLARRVRLLRNRCLEEAGCEINAAHFLVFMFFAKHEGSTEKQAAYDIGCDKTLVAKAVKKLVQQDQVICRRDEKDARYKRVWLTNKGKHELLKVEGALTRITETMAHGMDKAQVDAFLTILQKMQSNITESLR